MKSFVQNRFVRAVAVAAFSAAMAVPAFAGVRVVKGATYTPPPVGAPAPTVVVVQNTLPPVIVVPVSAGTCSANGGSTVSAC